ncbi:MAG: hypothetical protein ACOYOU_06810 [Kiritimatiellia bacterium]
MEPLRTVEFALRFAATWSAWWLLLALPLVVLVSVALYRIQSRVIAWGHAWGLTLLRVVIMAAVVFLAFRPSLIRRDTATFPGRLLVVLDDSASMGIHDPALPEADALRIARQATDRLVGREAPITALREEIVSIERTLIGFESFGRAADRTQDAFWRETERVQVPLNERLGNIAQRATDLGNSTSTSNQLHEVAAGCREFQTFLKPLFSGNTPPSAEFVQKMRKELVRLTDLLDAAQAASDRKAMVAGDPALTAALGAVRHAPRLDLAYGWLRQHREALIGNHKGLGIWMLPLSQQEPTLLSRIGPAAPPISKVETDISGVLLQRIEEESPFPMAGVLLVSDGRNLGATPLDTLTRAAALRSIPIYCAGVGSTEEPPDIAIRGAFAPPFAVAGVPLGVRTSIKTVLPKPDKFDLALLADEKRVITNETLEINEQQEVERRLIQTPLTEGLQRLTVRASSVDGEVVPQANNRLDWTIRIRPEPIRVLFLDWKPRWESRFVLNILSRLDYLDVNSIIVLSQPGSQLKRGVGKGFWPEDAGTLALYDLIILGDLPADALKQPEWKQLAEYVEAGGSLVMLGTGQRDPLPPVAQNLLPTKPRTLPTPSLSDTATLQLTLAGLHHPITRSLRGIAPQAENLSADRLQPKTIGLLQSSDGSLLLSTSFQGKGKALFVDTDRLWRRLNASALDAHAMMVANMADWAIEAHPPATNRPQPDLYRYTTRESVQVWAAAGDRTNVVVLRQGDQELQAPAVPAHAGTAWTAAVFDHVPAGDWIVSIRGGAAAPEPLRVVDRNRELYDLSRDDAYLRSLAANSGGACEDLTETGRLLNDVQPRSRVERQEHIWRLWDSGWVLALLVTLLTAEWIWRKLAGLV